MGSYIILVPWPVYFTTPKNVICIDVISNEYMYQAVLKHFTTQDIVIKSAAVSDYRDKKQATEKIKKQSEQMSIEVERNKDILKTLGKQKTDQFLVGFAAETTDVKRYGQEKLTEKNLDAIVINDVSKEGIGFGSDDNEVLILLKDGEEIAINKTSKLVIARQLLSKIAEKLKAED